MCERCMQAWEEYGNLTIPARKKYHDLVRSAREEYEKIKAMAEKEWETMQDEASAEFREVKLDCDDEPDKRWLEWRRTLNGRWYK